MTKTLNAYSELLKIFFAIIIMVAALPFSCHASDWLWDDYTVPESRQKERLLDNADLLTNEEEQLLLKRLDSVSNNWECNVAILTVDDYSGTIQDFADDYFDYNGFGADFNGSGILFVIAMSDRSWAISTSGSAIYAFTDYGQEYMINQMGSFLSNNDFYGAFDCYIDLCDELLYKYSQGTPLDVNSDSQYSSMGILSMIFISLAAGCGLATLPILFMKSQLKTVRMATTASGYQSSKGLDIRRKSDRFIRRTITKTPIPRDSGSRGGSGGSSMHTSSSGSSHGGSSGHF